MDGKELTRQGGRKSRKRNCGTQPQPQINHSYVYKQHLLLDGYQLRSAEALRLLYVAMTRAKHNLSLHYNGNYLQALNTAGLTSVEDRTDYPPPSQLAMQLTHKDVWLDFFLGCQPSPVYCVLAEGRRGTGQGNSDCFAGGIFCKKYQVIYGNYFGIDLD